MSATVGGARASQGDHGDESPLSYTEEMLAASKSSQVITHRTKGIVVNFPLNTAPV